MTAHRRSQPIAPIAPTGPTAPSSAPSEAASPDADEALARHRAALQERFPLPPQALSPLPHATRDGATAGQRRRRARLLAVALPAAAAALLAWQDPAWRTEHIATGPDRRASVELVDGSVVELDTSTRLTVSRHLRSRRVVLQEGRALFDVQPSRWRPFLVDAGSTQVRVLGTAFDVRRRGDDVMVTVLRGRVAVAGNHADATLQANDQIHVQAGALGSTAPVNATDATAWRHGHLVFDRTPLPEVLAEIARYSGRPVRLGDASLAQLEVSGVYRTANADALLTLLPSFLPVRVDTPPDADGERWVLPRPGRP